ncbi:hypothetical protein ACFU99_42155, partial [Streptomyces sp. NPDC057654]
MTPPTRPTADRAPARTDTGPAANAREPALMARVRRRVAAGYRPAGTWDTPVEHLLPARETNEDSLVTTLGGPDALRGGLALLMPTQTARGTADEQRASVTRFLDCARRLADARPGTPLALLIGMQWRPGDE